MQRQRMMLHTESENQDLIGACLYGERGEELEHGAPTASANGNFFEIRTLFGVEGVFYLRTLFK